MNNVTNSGVASKKQIIATYKKHLKKQNPLAYQRTDDISTTTSKQIPKWRQETDSTTDSNNQVADPATNDNKVKTVPPNSHFSILANVENVLSKNLGNDNKNGNISTILATSGQLPSYLQVALALEHPKTPVYLSSNKNSLPSVDLKLVITKSTSEFTREPRYKKLKPNHPRPRILYCPSIKQSIVFTKPILTTQPTETRYSLSSDYIDSLLRKPNPVLDAITAKLQGRNNKNYYSALFDGDIEDNFEIMTSNNSALDLTSPNNNGGADDDDDCKPAAIVPQALTFEPAKKKNVNPKFFDRWQNIHKNVNSIASTLLTIDQVTGTEVAGVASLEVSDEQEPSIEPDEQPWMIHTNQKNKQAKEDPYGNTIANVSPVVIPPAPRNSPTSNIQLEYFQPL